MDVNNQRIWHILPLFVLILLLNTSALAQRGFYARDTSLYSGIKINMSNKITNALQCTIDLRDSVLTFSPDEIRSYGIQNGEIYVSKKVEYNGIEQAYFLERLINGPTKLYFLATKTGKTYFVERDTTLLVELKKNDDSKTVIYKKQLHEMTSDFPEIADQINFVNYNRAALTRFFNDYNQRLDRPFPHIRFGALAAWENTRLIVSEKYIEPAYQLVNDKQESSFAVGLFADIPIMTTYFSLHTEAILVKHAFSYFEEADSKGIDFVANITSLKIPALLRYTFVTRKISPFVNAGGVLAYNFKKNGDAYITSFNNDIIKINTAYNQSLFSDFQSGIAAGLGLEYHLNARHSLFLEFRYNKFLKKESIQTIDNSDLQVITSINF
ncbi:outer membrane beta-barrel protein [Maribellus sediminis]|uniref:outer membrane beta-barrel protein n=1 Tax=Maribellus sediminis TaxID=2696285 RepID=UPI00142FA033|nr:outer membrane beta-barrel protein [Maribellus sediminis]